MSAARSEHFRAKFDSGMRDADTDELLVPENFSKARLRDVFDDDACCVAVMKAGSSELGFALQESMEMFLHYVYHDELRPGAAVEGLASLVHVAVFFGTQVRVVIADGVSKGQRFTVDVWDLGYGVLLLRALYNDILLHPPLPPWHAAPGGDV